MTGPKKYRTKPVFVEAMELENTSESAETLANWAGGVALISPFGNVCVQIPTVKERLIVQPGSIVYTVHDGVFLATTSREFHEIHDESPNADFQFSALEKIAAAADSEKDGVIFTKEQRDAIGKMFDKKFQEMNDTGGRFPRSKFPFHLQGVFNDQD